tara:strand:+ start:191 stop:553 length:363 start_codon:yes stop_codon:yes gene_type:complete
MPTPRKRIGFLPRPEVQDIIDQICKNNKLSQSRVTGILVEEALSTRGVLKSYSNTKNNQLFSDRIDLLSLNNDNLNNESQKDNEKFILDKKFIDEEVQMINDYIKYKFFKTIMIKNKKND